MTVFNNDRRRFSSSCSKFQSPQDSILIVYDYFSSVLIFYMFHIVCRSSYNSQVHQKNIIIVYMNDDDHHDDHKRVECGEYVKH
jgi:hypothetical protein